MGVLIDGVLARRVSCLRKVGRTGEFVAPTAYSASVLPRTGSSGFKAEAGRYHLLTSPTAVRADRTLIYRALKTEGAIMVADAIPGLKEQGWTFQNNPAFPDRTPDTVNGFYFLASSLYRERSRYTGKVKTRVLPDWVRASAA